MSEQGTIFQRGDLVWCRTDEGMWVRGIATDVFVAPVTHREVVVVHGSGYYTDDVVPDPGESMDVPEPVRGEPCDVCGALVYVDRKDGLVRVLATREPHTCPVPEPQSLRA